MTLAEILGTIFLGPLKLIFEVVFSLANSFIGNPGLSIIVLSLVMNIMAFPLYQRADKMQEASRDIEAKLHKGVSHIKKTFSGDEKMMILQTYYRQNNYKPMDSLKGSVSLLLEIPFFIAAYQFLSHVTILDGVPLGPITDLGSPDGLLTIGAYSINLLPFIMTIINIITSSLHLKGHPIKAKVQLYGMALIFLVLLYKSPAGLVFYWTLNNLFSLAKTILYKLENPRIIISVITAIIGFVFIVLGFVYETESIKRIVFLWMIGIALQLPMVLYLFKAKKKSNTILIEKENNTKLFLLGTVFLTVFIGILIPSNYIAASPQEFIDPGYYYNPLWYLIKCLSMAVGTFLVWMRVFYGLASKKGKRLFDVSICMLCICSLINYMFFGTNLGIISSKLQYENGMVFSITEQVVNLGVIFAVTFIMFIIMKKWKKSVSMILVVAIVSFGVMSTVNVMKVSTSVSEFSTRNMEKDEVSFKLSKNGKNVVVIMLDRALGYQLPYIFNEKPVLKEKFDGFTYYENTISFGGSTNFCVPSLFGGYEYTPVEMNKRSEEALVDKHNEAIKVLPRIFADNGYKVTMCDPIYANYQWISDTSIYDSMEGVNAYLTESMPKSEKESKESIGITKRNFFCFSVMKSMPVFVQPVIYNNGIYHQLASDSIKNIYTTQVTDSVATATGMSELFMKEYNTLSKLKNMTKVSSEKENTFLMFTNEITHEPMLLQTPDYIPSQYVDNQEYEKQNEERFTVNSKTLQVNDTKQMIHYHANMAALIQLSKWLDYLKENDVYDNTRIVIVADHGAALYQLNELVYDGADVGAYFPLLMVKDFNARDFSTSSEFMTIADVPIIAIKDIIKDPRNPYTGKVLDNSEKYKHDQFISLSWEWDIAENNGNTFSPSGWARVRENIWDKNNWKFYNEEIVLKDNKIN